MLAIDLEGGRSKGDGGRVTEVEIAISIYVVSLERRKDVSKALAPSALVVYEIRPDRAWTMSVGASRLQEQHTVTTGLLLQLQQATIMEGDQQFVRRQSDHLESMSEELCRGV